MELSQLFPREELENLPPSDWRYRLINSEDPQVEDMRGCISRLLSFAQTQGVLNAEMLARLGNDDYNQFRSAIHELAVAEFLLPLGSIDWHPSGRGSRIGEFRIILKSHEPIFVEVKTIFVTPEESRRDRNWDILRNVAHTIASPFRMNVEFLKLERDVIPRRFRPWLQRHIRYCRTRLTKLYQEYELIFTDKSEEGAVEIKVEFTRIHDSDLPTVCDMSSGVNQIDLHERVKTVIDGSLKQLPDNQPTLVVIASTAWVGLDVNEMLAAMFSYPKVTFSVGVGPIKPKDTTVHYSLEGIVQPSIRTRLSAAGVWHHSWARDSTGSLDIYHNPLASKVISPAVFALLNVCQLIPKDEHTMEWTPHRPIE